jgi:hypothetical protein
MGSASINEDDEELRDGGEEREGTVDEVRSNPVL